MSNLFILGNGFDSAHKIPTSYRKFKEFFWEITYQQPYSKAAELKERRKNRKVPDLPPMQIYTRTGILRDFNKECKLLYWLIDRAAKRTHDMNWCQFEILLDKLDFRAVLRWYKTEEHLASILAGTLDTLEEVFFLWIGQIDLTAKDLDYLRKCIDKDNDLAISFNYTETLETVYGLRQDNVRHLHGKRETDPDVVTDLKTYAWNGDKIKLVVGHDGARSMRLFNLTKHFHQKRKSNTLQSLYSYMQKDSEGIVSTNHDFFVKIANASIQDIYSFGFSYSSVDQPQIKAVCDALNNGEDRTINMVWHLHAFDEKGNKNKKYMKQIRRAGFKGQFVIYGSQ